MFTGIIEEIGEITAVETTGDSSRITVRAPKAAADSRRGDSIAVSGVCLTVVDRDRDSFQADVMAETLAASTLATASVGRAVNIERALQIGDRLGGHIVQGHVDGTADVERRTDGARWRVLRFRLDPSLAPLVAYKGSVALDGVSLTVSAVGDDWFEVSLIPETLEATTLGALEPGADVNVETDILARHIRRLSGFDGRAAAQGAMATADVTEKETR
jgi:riboflavin synthase